jgi:chemotaxis signal transduction protein/CheY-like chemotaxis protein
MLESQKKSIQSGENIVFLPFSLTHEENEVHFCLNVQKIYTVLELDNYSSLPGVMDPFVMLIDVHGMPIPVLDLSHFVSKIQPEFLSKKIVSKSKRRENKRIIVCYFLNMYIGIIVDFTRKIMILPNELVLPPPGIWVDNSDFFVSGLVNENGKYRYLFDIEKYISHIGIHLGEVGSDRVFETSCLKGIRMLIVEDSTLFQMLIKKAFAKYDVQMDVAKDGKEGLFMLTEKENGYDIIISDIEMPLMNGIEMIRRYRELKRRYPLPVLFHSAISNPNLVQDIQKEELGEFVSKFNEEEIVSMAENMLLKHKKMLEDKKENTTHK